MKEKHIILGITASIAIYKACQIARRLFNDGIGLSIIMTQNATRLVSPRVFSSLITAGVCPPSNYSTKEKSVIGGGVYWDGFAHPGSFAIEHISLAQRAQVILIAPATANIIGKISSGIADDLLTTTIMASRAPVLIAPAMNENMYRNKIVQANIKRLKSLGYKFIEPSVGRLACGEIGIGHLAAVETIVKQAKRLLK